MAKQELIMAEKAIYDTVFHGSITRWIRMGDKTSKEFIQTKRPRHPRIVMRDLNREDGTTTEDGEEMRNIATTYYKRLLTEESMATREDRIEDISSRAYPRKS